MKINLFMTSTDWCHPTARTPILMEGYGVEISVPNKRAEPAKARLSAPRPVQQALPRGPLPWVDNLPPWETPPQLLGGQRKKTT